MNATPTLAEVLRAAVQDGLREVHVCMPATVESFDGKENSCSVRPSIQVRVNDEDDVAQELPIINSVPVVYPRGGAFSMKWDLKRGDPVLLVFSERSLDVWKSQGGSVDPLDPRRFHLSDAFALPGGASFSQPLSVDTSDRTVLISGKSRIDMMNTGMVKIGNGSQEFLDLMSKSLAQLITGFGKLATDTVNTQIGPQKLNAFSAYDGVKSALTDLKNFLDQIKGA